MNELQALMKMVPPGQKRPRKWRGGVLQIWITRRCDKACFGCTQGSNYGDIEGVEPYMSLDYFEQACESLNDYFGVVGMFGGNPAMHPQFPELCEIMRKHIPFAQRGLWCNNLFNEKNGVAARDTFNPAVSNINVHMDRKAWEGFKQWWPESIIVGLRDDSRHHPVYWSPRIAGIPEEDRLEKISQCDINQKWSAMIGVFRGELRGYFCEIAGSMSMLKQIDPDWPDTGVIIEKNWWRRPMVDFVEQVRQHCHDCGMPWKGYGELACAGDNGVELITPDWENSLPSMKKGRTPKVSADLEDLKPDSVDDVTRYLQNARK